MSSQIITYNELSRVEGNIQLQKGMNFGIRDSYSIVLMSVRKNSPYNDEMLDNVIIKYEGHDVPSRRIYDKKHIDQSLHTASGTLTENGKFHQAAETYKQGKREPAKIKVYRKLQKGIWVDMGFYDLIDVVTENDGNRNVFKFLLKPLFENFDPKLEENIDIIHRRYIPGPVMQEVFKRDGHTKSINDKMVGFDEIKSILGLSKYLEIEKNLK